MSAGRFCVVWLCAVVVLLVFVGAFDAGIDPYLVIGAPRIRGLNAAKPETETHTELAKDYLIGRARPAGLMLGDSKVDIGLDSLSPAWPEDARPVFNDGVPGIRLENVLDRLRIAVASLPVRRVLVTVNPQEVMAPPPADVAPAKGQGRWDRLQRAAHDLSLATLSLDALRASLATVAAQGRRDVVDMSPLGDTSEGGFRQEIARSGYDAVFVQKDAELVGRFARLATRLSGIGMQEAENLAPVAEIIAVCRQHRIALDLVIPPVHADYLDAIDRAGLWLRYEHVKASVTHLVAQMGDSAVRLWDFGGYDAYSTEAVPPPGGGGTNWFWEPSHFKKALGEIMLAAIYNGGAYGARLTPDMVDAHLVADSRAKADYEAKTLDARLARVAP